MARQEKTQQQHLFTETQAQYGWKSITDVQKGDTIVIIDQELKVLGMKTEENTWFLSYTDPETNKKVEQLYNANDFVYTRI